MTPSQRERVRVGLFSPNYPGVSGDGGIGTYAQNLAHSLCELGHKTRILTPGSGPPVSEGPFAVHLTSTSHLPFADRFWPGAGACWRVALAMQRLVRDQKLDVVEFPNWEGLGLLFQKLSNTPVVVRLHTSSKETQVIDQLPSTRTLEWDVRREFWQAHRAAALVTHSEAHRALMSAELGISRERIHLIPHGVPTFPDFERPPRMPGPPTVVYLGRMEKRKGTLDLLQAIPAVLARIPDARFVLIGADRPHCPGNRTHAQYLADEFSPQVQRQVTLAGRLPQADVDRWLQTADLFVAPSLYESFGLIFPEAMRWGTPVIGTRVGGVPEIITDGKTGLLVDAGEPIQLAQAILRMLTNDDLRQTLGVDGRSHVETNFSVVRMARSTAELYASVIERKGARHVAAAS